MDATDHSTFTALKLRNAVRDLSQFVANERAKPTPDVVAALDVYVHACKVANERLGECLRLGRAGQRSEALRQIQLVPDVLEMYNDLQFKHVDGLHEACEEHDMTAPPRLDAAAASWLNEAFTLEKSQQALLREHRLLALRREPLKRRLDVLRMIEKEFPKEPFWQDDVMAYELRRIEEIRDLIADPDVRGTWDTVLEFHKESEASTATRTPFPIELVDAIRKARGHLLKKAAVEQLGPINEELQAERADVRVIEALRLIARGASPLQGEPEYVASRLDRVKRLISQADEIQKKFELPDGLNVMSPVNEAAEWHRSTKTLLRNWRSFKQAVAELQNALNNGLDWHYIQLFYLTAAQYGMPIPADVYGQFRQRSRSRVKWWVVGGVGVALALFLAVAAFVIAGR